MSNKLDFYKQLSEVERKLTDIVRDFESLNGHIVEIRSFKIERMRAIGPRAAIVIIDKIGVDTCISG